MTDVPRQAKGAHLLLGLLALHVVCAFAWPWEEDLTWFQLSPDFILLVAAGLIAVLRAGPRTSVAVILAAFFLLVPVYRFGATAVPVFLGKPFEPWNDVLYLRGLDHLLTHRLPEWSHIPVLVLSVVLLVAIYAGLVIIVRSVLRAAASGRRAVSLLVLLQLAVVAGWAERSLRPVEDVRLMAPGIIGRAAGDLGTLLRTRAWRIDEVFAEDAAAVRAELATTPKDLGRLSGIDVHLLWIESYGRAAYRAPATVEMEELCRELETELDRAGVAAASAFAFPSIRGGASPLAHSEFLCGVAVENHRIFERLIASDLVPLSRILVQAGWQAINAQPVMSGTWPEGDRFFGYTKSFFREAFPYPGPDFHWGSMPDQFALGHLLRTELQGPGPPVFLHYVGVTSHSPFSMIPRYRPEWDRLDDPESWMPEKTWPIDWLNYSGHPDVERAYLDAIRYDLRTMAGFACRLRRPSFLIVLGDHQPPAVGALTRADPTRDVPLHLLTNRPSLLEPFLAQGFTSGLVPSGDEPSFSFRRFLFRFLRAFSTAADERR